MSSESVTRYETDGGVRIYRIPVRAFPTLIGNVYVVVAGDYAAIVDSGSGLSESNADLQAGFAAIRENWGEALDWGDLRRIVITHAHIDHHGGVNMLRTLSDAPIAIHELDRRVLVHYEERLALTSFRLNIYLRQAGVPARRRAELEQLYTVSKELVQSVPVADTLHDGDLLDGLFRIHHLPGHCPGQVALQIEDVLLSADQVLPETAPFLSPETLTPSTGVEHYLQSLRKLNALSGIRLALGGHEAPMDDLYGSIATAEQMQQFRIERVHAACVQPQTIAEITAAIYPQISGYNALLAIQKIGAYIEYLDQRGKLAVDNLDELLRDEHAAPRYRQA